jgi:pyruvyltransferase
VKRRRLEIYRWNERAPLGSGPLSKRLHVLPRYNNFGDLLAPVIVAALARRAGLSLDRPRRSGRLVSVGSVIHLTRPGDVLWGTGVNGQHLEAKVPGHLDIRAVRGPRTRGWLTERGIEAPDVFGDPVLLLGLARPDLVARRPRHDTTVIFNMRDAKHVDWEAIPRGVNVVNAQAPVEECLLAISESRLVVASALHGIIVAEALGIPARAIQALVEPAFKYHDYFEGTGREYAPVANIEAALGAGGDTLPAWNRARFEEAFPVDLWEHA